MKVKSICIIGGGTSGWCTALALQLHTPSVEVTLVESSNIGTIGVGEATQPEVFQFFNDYLGIKEADWMRKTDATYKVGGVFRNFNNLSPSDVVHHTFWNVEEEEESDLLLWGLKKALGGSRVPNTDYASTFFAAPYMALYRKFSKRSDVVWYAGQLDATKFAGVAKSQCLSNGLNYVVGDVVDVDTSEEGISRIHLHSGEILTSDLFIDCTGFKALLIEQHLGSKFTDMTDLLPNNNAIAARIPYEDKKAELGVHTDCQALKNGWVWTVPLWSRIGTGYVYSDKYITKKEAEAEFRQHLIAKYGEERMSSLELRHIPMRVGYRETSWVKNCVSIGLSSQFVEPLESTGLLFVSQSIKKLIGLLNSSDMYYNNLTRDRYSKYSRDIFEEAFDFVLLHYINTQRGDSKYWRHIRDKTPVPARLIKTLASMEHEVFGASKLVSHIFPRTSWDHILVGFNILNIGDYINVGHIDPYNHDANISEGLDSLEMLRCRRELEVRSMPYHYDYLKENIYGNDSDS